MKVLFGTVIYPAVVKYMEQLMDSLNNQDYKAFDICVMNDGVEDRAVIDRLRTFINKDIYIIDVNNSECVSLFSNRMRVVDYAIEYDYDVLVFGDADDTFSNSRICRIVDEYCMDYDIYYNDMLIGHESMFGERLPRQVDSVEQIMHYNFMGLSNTAININTTKDVLKKIPYKNVTAVDWYIYSYLLLNLCKAKYLDGCATFYRIHDTNIAGETADVNWRKLEVCINVVEEHYNAMSNIDMKYTLKLESIKRFKESMRDVDLRNAYLNAVNQNAKNLFWWEVIDQSLLEALKHVEN